MALCVGKSNRLSPVWTPVAVHACHKVHDALAYIAAHQVISFVSCVEGRRPLLHLNRVVLYCCLLLLHKLHWHNVFLLQWLMLVYRQALVSNLLLQQ